MIAQAPERYLRQGRAIPSRQTHLGRSEHGDLIIIRPPPTNTTKYPPPVPRDRGILRLPDEVLTAILEIAGSCAPTADEEWGFRPEHPEPADYRRNAVAISIVCRRFNRIITPILYRELSLGFLECCKGPSRRPYRGRFSDRMLVPRAVKHLYRTLRENPTLGPLCRRITITVPAEQSRCLYPLDTCLHYLMCKDLIRWLSNTQDFELRIFNDYHFGWPILSLRATRDRAGELTGISLAGMSFPAKYYMPAMKNYFTQPGLSSLLSLAWLGHGGPAPIPNRSAWSSLNRSLLITSVNLTGYEESVEDLQKLLLFPRGLKMFNFSVHCEYSGDTWPWSLPKVFSALTPHRETLTSITISSTYTWSSRGLTGMNLEQFPALESLSLARSDTGIDQAEEINAILAAPKLQSFTWDQTSTDQQISESLRAFRPDHEEAFVRKLGETAISRKLPLRRIHIIFRPDPGFFTSEEDRPDEYPWDRMDRLSAHLNNLAMETEPGKTRTFELTYHPPTISREVYDNPPWIEWRREREEQRRRPRPALRSPPLLSPRVQRYIDNYFWPVHWNRPSGEGFW